MKEYLSFSRKERTGVISLLILIIFIWNLPRTMPLFRRILGTGSDTVDIRLYRIYGDSILSSFDEVNNEDAVVAHEEKRKSLFHFDPNRIGKEEWQRLGLNSKTSERIVKYVSKGGRFRKPEDLKKIYGIRKDDLDALLPYVRIENSGSERSPVVAYSPSYEGIEKKSFARKEISVIDLNSADTSALIELPGIGSKLANRIVAFRDKLGGFYTLEQLREVYGLNDSTYEFISRYLKLEGDGVRKFNLNEVTVDELKQHPYFKWQLANAIVSFRVQHGSFRSLEELKKISIMDERAFERCVRYLFL